MVADGEAMVCVRSEWLIRIDRALLEENGITGWSTYPIEVYDRKGNSLPDYHGFAITGGTCDQDYDLLFRSLMVEKIFAPFR